MSRLARALQRLHDQRAEQASHATPAFDRQLEALRRWQADRIEAWHRDLAARHDGEALLHYLACTFYRDADWSELTASPERTAARIGRIIKNDRPLLVAIELQIVTNTLDAAVARALHVASDDAALSPPVYVRAFRMAGQPDLREQQLGYVAKLVDLLGQYAENRAAYWAFRMAGTPARAMGLGDTYALLADGFAALRATRDFRTATGRAIERQRARVARLLPHP